MPSLQDTYDTVIIGAGIIGCAVAWSLSKYDLKILVLEAQDDIACGATKANSGIVHAGYDCYPGTLKAKLNVEGAAMFPKIAKDLDIPFKTNGSLVLCFHEEEHDNLVALYERGITNGVPNLELLTGEQAAKLEPIIAPGLYSALWAKTAGIISPYEAATAFAENAADNGCEFLIETVVNNIVKDALFTVSTNKGKFSAKAIVNAAGTESHLINNYVSDKKEEIIPQRGQYYLLDKEHEDYTKCTLFPLPGPLGKGVLIAPTMGGNPIIGPNADEFSEKFDFTDSQDVKTTRAGLDEVLEKASLTVKSLPINSRITAFAGVRAKHHSKDFVINEPVPGFINALGIDSPGLSAAPAIGNMIADMIASILEPNLRKGHISTRKGIIKFNQLSFKEQEALVNQNPDYGQIVCRCETITEAEIVSAIRRPVGARNLTAIKRRTRATGGRCQGGFCSVRLVEILSRELGVSEESIWN